MKKNLNIKDQYKKLPVFSLSSYIRKSNTKKKPKSIIYGNFGAMNYGDDAILEGQLADLKKIHSEVTVVGRFKKEILRRHSGVKAVSITDIPTIIGMIITSDFIVVGGGGLISKNDNGPISLFYQFYCLGLFMLLPHLLRKPVYVWGYGIYKNANSAVINFGVKLLKNADIVAVRDTHSYKLLTSRGVKVKLFKDNSYLSDIALQRRIVKLPVFKNSYDKKRKNIGLALKRPESEKDGYKLKKLVLELFEKHTNSEFWLYTLDYQAQYDNDKNYAQELMRSIGDKPHGNRVHLVPVGLSNKEVFGSFKLMDGLIAMRLHSLIFAYRQNVKFIAISYDEKCKSFLDAIGHEYFEVRKLNKNSFLNFVNTV